MRIVVTSRAWTATSNAPLVAWSPVPDPLLWQRRDQAMVAWGTAATLPVGTGPDRADRVTAALRGIEVDGDPSDLRVFASLTFDRDAPDSIAVIPRRILVADGDDMRLVRIDPVDDDTPVAEPPAAPAAVDTRGHADRIRFAGSSLPDLLWMEAVDAAVRTIAAGTLSKVVLARDHAVWSHQPFDTRAVASRLHARFPSCWTFHLAGLVGATPELLLQRRGTTARSLVLAGTVRRDDDPDTDAKLGRQLLQSDKDQREHRSAAASVVRGLEAVATDVQAPDEPGLLALDNVQHLATEVTARLVPDDHGDMASALEVADLLHPTAAVGGEPTGAALGHIRRLECMDRDRYAAPIGWMDATGDGEFGIALRCARLSGARARLFAGAGIVTGSLPEDELEETRLKLRAMQQALQADPAR